MSGGSTYFGWFKFYPLSSVTMNSDKDAGKLAAVMASATVMRAAVPAGVAQGARQAGSGEGGGALAGKR